MEGIMRAAIWRHVGSLTTVLLAAVTAPAQTYELAENANHLRDESLGQPKKIRAENLGQTRTLRERVSSVTRTGLHALRNRTPR